MLVYMQKKKIVYLLLVCIPAAFLFYFFIFKSEKQSVDHNMQKRPAYRTKMEGLSFLAMDRGRKVIAIKADRFILRNMKVGFFSFSMATVAALENVTIDIYSADAKDRKDSWPADETVATKHLPEQQNIKHRNALDFKGVLSKETFASFPVKSITSIEASPIVFTLYDDKKILTRISAQKATVRFRDRDVLFDGDVTVISGPRELRSESLRLSPADGTMEAKQYSMVTKNGNASGQNLKTDLLLMNR